MGNSGARSWLIPVALCGTGYLAISLLTTWLGALAPSSQTRAWRLAAWLVSAVVFGTHIVFERWRRHSPAPITAVRAALAAALGSFLLAAAAVFHTLTTGEGNLSRLAIAFVAWPVITAVPAFLVALAVAALPLGPRALLSAFMLACLLPGAATYAASQKPSVSAVADSLRALEKARGEALMHADTTALSRMTADDFVEISRLGQLRTKADNLRDIASGVLKLTSVKYDSTTVRVYGDVAVVTAIADNTGTFRGFPFEGRIWYTRIFVKRDGRWQAVTMQHTMIP